MAWLDYQRTIIGYHGCDRLTAERVLLGRGRLSPSQNDYDWLGGGIYFWEYGPERALDWARAVCKRHPNRIRQPAVLGAIIHSGVCFDLLDVRFTTLVKIVVPNRLRPEILRDLDYMNVNRATLFPGIDGFAQSLYHAILHLEDHGQIHRLVEKRLRFGPPFA
jgi:hypothetical protein